MAQKFFPLSVFLTLLLVIGFMLQPDPKDIPGSSDAGNQTELYDMNSNYTYTGNDSPVLTMGNNMAYLTEGFEGVTFPPTGWATFNTLGTEIWARSTYLPRTGVGCAFIDYEPTGGEDWLMTPQFSVTAGDSIVFWLSCPNYVGFSPDSLAVRVSTTTQLPATIATYPTRILYTAEGAGYPTTVGVYKRFAASLNAFGGQSVYIAFRHCDRDGDGINIDDVVIGTPAPPITHPTVVCNYGAIPQYPSGLWGHASCVLGDTLYVVGGSSAGGASTTSARCYIPTGTWSAGTPLPVASTGHGLVKAGNKMYVVGMGSALGAGIPNCYSYTPATGWTAIANFPTPRNGCGTVVWGDSVVFVVSGGWSTYSTQVDFYRIATNTWGTSTALPGGAGRRSMACGIYNNKIFVIAGYSGTFRKDVRIGTIGSNAQTITWTQGTDVPMRGTGSSRPGGTVLDDRFYFITGETTPAPTLQDSIYVMNAATNTWTSTIITGRGSNTASNYFSSVNAYVYPNGNGAIFFPGGALGTAFPGFMALKVPPCIVGIGDPNSEIPETYSLSQNYPNPFNPTTNIKFSIPKAGNVKLVVFDILGREVKTLVNEFRTVGNYVVNFNAESLASGVYFYTLNAGNYTETKKMLLIK